MIYGLVSFDVHRGRVDFTDILQMVSTVPNEMGFSTRYQELHGISRHAHVLLRAMCVLGYPGKSPSALCKSSVMACSLNRSLQIKGKKYY